MKKNKKKIQKLDLEILELESRLTPVGDGTGGGIPDICGVDGHLGAEC